MSKWARGYTPDEWLEKADYEGGIYSGFEYGLTADDVSKAFTEFRATVARAQEAFECFQETLKAFPDDYETSDEDYE